MVNHYVHQLMALEIIVVWPPEVFLQMVLLKRYGKLMRFFIHSNKTMIKQSWTYQRQLVRLTVRQHLLLRLSKELMLQLTNVVMDPTLNIQKK